VLQQTLPFRGLRGHIVGQVDQPRGRRKTTDDSSAAEAFQLRCDMTSCELCGLPNVLNVEHVSADRCRFEPPSVRRRIGSQ